MGRKKKGRGFEWVADDSEGEAMEKVVRPNRSEAKRARKRFENLARSLSKLSAGHRAQLPMDDALIQAVQALADAKNAPDRRRKLLRLTTLLVEAEVDVDALDEVVRKMG